MRFLIITHVLHKPIENSWFAYAPYVREMNLWLKYVDEVEIVAPVTKQLPSAIDTAYKDDNIIFTQIPEIAFVSLGRCVRSFFSLPFIIFSLFMACKRADHIHLRCPGNIGLLGCLVQICFPKKVKTAKYAGNWDPNAMQPLSYRLQKKIISSTFWTKNMTALVYGNWQNQTKNIKPFFTATFNEADKVTPTPREYSGHLKFVFIGGLVEGKRPLFAIQMVEKLNTLGYNASLEIFGDGILKQDLIAYCNSNSLNKHIIFHGNQDKNVIKKALQTTHFVILASKSEGWPKAIAEAMFFGVIPIATSVSCVPFMLNNGNRGILISDELEKAVTEVANHLPDYNLLAEMSKKATLWSQQYTLEGFEYEIKKLIVA
ncbi:glycosyltransferase involved in cell wall biosynthesis [Jejuia pallidilutea]|uniref:Glycosyltransferase involved in cell wall biosynthesis n=1 Tax=Jejuia pallidilutea TaxID=504487 RepID=A0A362WYN4_9FLAO|nr:glycosyltransferase [Jejuia pallidilutea]PQV47296.1 glycosyltransferase involved in cell wall biosynthesis [Jejuia pallidilutea]